MKNYSEKDFEKHIEEQLQQSGYQSSSPKEYDKELCLIPSKLIEFIKETQPKKLEKLTQLYGADTTRKLANRVSEQIQSRGVVDVLRKGIKDRVVSVNFNLVYFQPKSGLNPEHSELFKKNLFIVIRQLKYSKQNENSIDMGVFINGIPIIMLELKNTLTGQTHTDAEKQWKTDRNHNEPLFRFARNLVYFAVGNEKVYMTTQLNGEKTKFLPFNKGIDNPVNPLGHKTHYLWDEILQPNSVLNIIEDFVHIVYDPKTKKVTDETSKRLMFPRYHQLNVIRKLKEDVLKNGTGHNYLIQHTTGSGKSLSIGWLAHLLSSIYQNPADVNPIFDSIVVVTDRRVLDKQIKKTILQLEQTKGVVNHVKDSNQLQQSLEEGKPIIITTIQKFPFISNKISKIKNKKFGVIIDEAHSSQGGKTAKGLKMSLSKAELGKYQEGEEVEDLTQTDKLILDHLKAQGKQPHISYFGFSGTPKNKTLEIFGAKNSDGEFEPFDVYSMKQSIAEEFTLNVLQNYTTYKRYFKLNKAIIEDKKLPKSSAKSMLVKWVDLHPHSIKEKTQIILEHFINHTYNSLQGKGRGMLVTKSRLHCVKFKLEFDKQMEEMKLPYRALVGFSGKVFDENTHQEYTESSMNGFPETQTEENFKNPKFRILIVNNKFQTGFDEPMLHTMYVDKKFSGLQCVQTLSRLNRSMAGKNDTFVLDFVNEPQDVQEAFKPYYEGTKLSEETDPNKLYDIEQIIKKFDLFTDEVVNKYVKTFYDDKIRTEQLQGILDTVVKEWNQLDEDKQEKFRKHISNFIRLYGYISQVITLNDPGLEKLYIFLSGLSNKLPRVGRPDLSDILSSVNLEYFKIEKKHTYNLKLGDGGDPLPPITTPNDPDAPDDEPVDFLSKIIKDLNDSSDGVFSEEDKVPLQNFQEKLRVNEELRRVMDSDNSDSNKRSKFSEIFKTELSNMAKKHAGLYNKILKSEQKEFISNQFFDNYNQVQIFVS